MMTQTEQQTDQRLERAIEDVHLDEVRHPDPSGQCLLRLLGAVEAHVRDESLSVETYERIGRETRDPVLAVVMELLVEDETHHYALLQRIATSLEAHLNWATDSPVLPTGDEPPRQTDPEMVEAVRELEDEERRGAQQLRDLAHRERTPETGLPCLLLETMAADSDKHAHLLAFVAEHLASRHSSR
jgi:hypothetical protein